MDSILIRGGLPLRGTIEISGAKNAALPLMAACLLTDEPLRLSNVPALMDIRTMAELLRCLGVEADDQGGGAWTLHVADIADTTAPYDIVRKMRASVLVLGPLLARTGKADVSLPGGCAIGTRPVNIHIDGLMALGAEIEIDGGYIRAKAPKGLTGAVYTMPQVSVGATENLLMAAVLARGTTVLENAAREPEIADLIDLLTAMGARIEGRGTDRLTVCGVDALHGADHAVLPDRIETGTYAVAGAITGGDLMLKGANHEIVEAIMKPLRESGATLDFLEDGIRVRRDGQGILGVDVMTQPYPGFPTDMQAQIMALMSISHGAAMITETIFENRFMHVPELGRMGADITVHGASALVRGVRRLRGAPVMATDLRASVSLVLAGLAADGETQVNRVYHLDRGYERLEQKLEACGADIERVKGQ
ncbi:UDP-N-acetylglucosamine 1-carboxyvinyltransferase [Minwuia thermotolerans]|uniref:UDP-N-acetylglucosamine 1-carboxyvinyltransferase n=1 Tax=Minwuia thermotolerans TaxID=2056226 RepID=A0A2M9G6W7_9PROT|nr:UDP-N-acetylglucosamine 1-carboxyvinyltransferase [Minwuia thermotolerans]PJK31469.1 UDP-N-acetylglucosamine 1-carboxyvinyltransferase [Minwuia thermotolerans]